MSSELRHRASLALNVVLIVTVAILAGWKLDHTFAPSAEVSSEIGTNEVAPGKATSERPVFSQAPKLPQYGDIASASDRRRWIIDQLRAMGVPNDTLALVARVDFEVQWESRFEACRGDRDKLAAVQLDMDMSKDVEMRAALGDAGFKQWDQNSMLWEAMSTEVEVTASEIDAIYALKKKLQQRELELEQASVKGTMDDAEINNSQDKAYSEYNQELKAVLGEDRYAKSQQLDDDTAAAQLHQDLAKANPGDSQFQELLKTQQQWNEQRAALDKQFQNDQSSAAYADQIRALNAARDQEYRRVLGDDVFNALQKEQDPSYTQMKRYETLWSLDDNRIDSVYGMLKYYQKSAEDYQAQARAIEAGGQNVDWDGVNKNLQAFAQETQQALQNYVGQDRFNRMAKNGVFQLSPPDLTGHSKPAQ
jgi:hypothetical protein